MKNHRLCVSPNTLTSAVSQAEQGQGEGWWEQEGGWWERVVSRRDNHLPT